MRESRVVMARKEGLIGRKIGMTQVFSEDGSHVPVTVIEAGPVSGDRDPDDGVESRNGVKL